VDDVGGYAPNVRIYPRLIRFELAALGGYVDNFSSWTRFADHSEGIGAAVVWVEEIFEPGI
jgi:hypothetical protein